MVGYFGLFTLCFFAATLLPGGSEIALSALLVADKHSVILLIAIATLGNVLGSVVNWLLGKYVERFENRSWYPVTPKQMDKARTWYHKYGRWSLLASWVPIIGDPLTLVAGVLKEPLASFVIIVAIAKLARYLVVAALVLQIF